MRHAEALAQLAREIARTRRAMATERAWRLGLWPLLALAAWTAIALFGLPDLLPPLAQSLLAIAALLGILTLCAFAWRRWRPPSEAEARARLAADSDLDPAAFEALEDQPSRLDAAGLQLWKIEQDRAIARAARAKARPARADLDHADRYRLRHAALVAVIAAAFVAGADAPGRLARAFYPDPGPLLGDGPIAVEAWLTPAEYTGAAPVSLSERIGETVETPPSVSATVRVTGPRGAPELVFEGGGRRNVVRFVETPDGAWEARIDIPAEGRLSVVRFHDKASWNIRPSPDNAPTIAFAEPITFDNEENASFSWRARDDYGVRELFLRVTPVNPPEGLVGAAPVDRAVESPGGDPREAEGEVEVNLADHPYAGLEVEARVVARDALGQEGVSEPLRVTLPEKVFLQPLALAAIEIRRMILWEQRPYAPAQPAPGGPAYMPAGDILTGTEQIVIRTDDQDPRLERAPAAIRRAASYLDSLTMAPQDGYFLDRLIFLGFRLAHSELENARAIEETDLAADTLWRTALRAEYGGAADARRTLELAQQALADALRNGASQERIAQLTEALRRAMRNYMQALVQEAMRNGQAQTQEDTEEQTELSQRDLQDLLDEIERLSREGRHDEAAALLQQLANIMQNLDVQLSQGGQGEEGAQGGQRRQQSDLDRSMDDLSEAMGEQRQLNEDTQAQAEGGQEGEQNQGGQGGAQDGQGLAQRQGEIRDQLNDARRQAGRAGAREGGEQLGQAEQAMRRAENALREGDLRGARAAQDEALRNLREGAASLASEMERRGQNESEGRAGQQSGELDPLGRARGGVGESGDTQIPAEAERARSREILDELRRRAQDPNRPESEREYLRRLLDRFTGS